MAAPVFPDNYGGARQLVQDPNARTMHTMLGDLAALNLRLSHAVSVMPGCDAATRAIIENVAADTREIVAASVLSHVQERATRELQPLTRLPPNRWGDTANVNNIRMYNIPVFTGETGTIAVTSWLARVFNLCQANTLTWEAGINLLIQGSSGGAADFIDEMRQEGKTVHQIVQQLEMRYGDLCTPEEARVRVNTMPRRESEELSTFIDRLRSMARMATRLERDDAARSKAVDTLVENNIRRVLPNSVRNALEERLLNISRMGLPSLSAREIEKECFELEKKRLDRKAAASQAGGGYKYGQVKKVSSCPPDDSEVESFDSSDEEPEVDDAMHHLIKEVRQQHNRYAQQGRRVEPQKIFKKAFNSFNKRPNRFQQGGYPYGARQAAQAPQGPPNKLDSQRRTIAELLTMANVERGCCIQCAQRGHILRQDACALKDKDLTDRPCAKCGQGLHSADDCLKVFQRQYVAQPQQPENVVSQVQTHLNEN